MRQRLPAALLSFGVALVLHTYLLVVRNDGFNPDPSRAVSGWINTTGNASSAFAIWGLGSAVFWSIIFLVRRLGVAGTARALLAAPLARLRGLPQAGSRGLGAACAGAGLALMLRRSLGLNAPASFCGITALVLLGSSPLASHMADALARGWGWLAGRLAEAERSRWELSLEGAERLIAGAAPGLALSLVLPPGFWNVAGIALVVGGLVLFSRQGRPTARAQQVAGLLIAVGAGLLLQELLAVLQAGIAFADDGGWMESGGDFAGWLRGEGSTEAVKRALGPAFAAILGTFAATDGTKQDDKKPKKIEWFRVVTITFRGDHHLVKHYPPPSVTDRAQQWLDGGQPFDKPEWPALDPQRKTAVPDFEGHPVSYTAGERIVLDIELEVGPPGAEGATATVHASSGEQFFRFQQEGPLRAGRQTLTGLRAMGLLPQAVAEYKLDLDWMLQLQGAQGDTREIMGGTSGPHRVLVTYGTPTESPPGAQRWKEDGVTLKRLAKAAELMGPIASKSGANGPEFRTDLHLVVDMLMEQLGAFNTHHVEGAPAEQPGFNRTCAWLLADYLHQGGECQALVRLVRGILNVLGFPGTVTAVAVWADTRPSQGGGQEARETDLQPVLSGKTPTLHLQVIQVPGGGRSRAALITGSVTEEDVGKTFKSSALGLNMYEACLKYEYGGRTLYFGGGAKVYSDAQDCLERVFRALVFLSQVGVQDREPLYRLDHVTYIYPKRPDRPRRFWTTEK